MKRSIAFLSQIIIKSMVLTGLFYLDQIGEVFITINFFPVILYWQVINIILVNLCHEEDY